MKQDFLKFFDLSFKKFLTRTSILVVVFSCNSSFATDAPSSSSTSNSPSTSPQSGDGSPNRANRKIGRGFGNLPPKKLETRADELIGEIVSPSSSNRPRSSGSNASYGRSDSSVNPPSPTPSNEGSEEKGIRMPKSSSFLSFPNFGKKEEAAPSNVVTDSGESAFTTIKTDATPRRESLEKKSKKQPPKELTPEQLAEEERAGKEADERARRILASHKSLRKIQEDNSSDELADSGTNLKESPKYLGSKDDRGFSPTARSMITDRFLSDPISFTVVPPNVDLLEGLGDVETSNFYPTPKSRHTGSTTLVRRVSSVIGNHLFVRSISKSAAAGDAGSEPVKFGFWGSSNLDSTSSTDTSVGSKNKTNVFSNTVGFDADIGDILIGGAVSLSKNRLGYTSGDSDGDKIKTNSKVFTLYSTIDLNWGMFNKTLVSYGSTRSHSYSDNPGYGLAESKYTQKMISAQTELGYNHKTGLLNYLISGGIRYIHTKTPEHTEWGAGIMNKTTQRDTGDDFEFIGSVGVNKLIKFEKYENIPHMTFSIRKKFAGQTPAIAYIRADSPNAYLLSGQNDKKMYYQIALGDQIKYKSSTLQLDLHYGFARKYSNIGGAVMLRLEI